MSDPMPTIARLEAEIDRLGTALDLEAKGRQAMAEAYAETKAALINLQERTGARMAVPDHNSPESWLIVYSSRDGIRSLEKAIDSRFEDGKAHGRAESADLIEALQASMRLAG